MQSWLVGELNVKGLVLQSWLVGELNDLVVVGIAPVSKNTDDKWSLIEGLLFNMAKQSLIYKFSSI